MPDHVVKTLDLTFETDRANLLGGQVRTTRVAPRVDQGRFRPVGIFGDEEGLFTLHHDAPRAWTPSDGFVQVSDAVVLPQGHILAGQSILCSESLMHPYQSFPSSSNAMTWTQRGDGLHIGRSADDILRLGGITASIVCDGWPIYGHWLVDVLPRLHRIIRFDDLVDRYLFPGPLTAWQRGLLAAYGMPEHRIVSVDLSRHTVLCDQLIAPTYDRFNSEVRPDLVAAHDRMAVQLGLIHDGKRRIFVSRKNTGARQMENRAEVEELARQIGLEIVYPETLPLRDQLRLFSSSTLNRRRMRLRHAQHSFFAQGCHYLRSARRKNHNFLQSQLCMLREQRIVYGIGKARAGSDTFMVRPEIAQRAIRAAMG